MRIVGELVEEVRRDRGVREVVLDLLLNHETSFFRDWSPFEAIRSHLFPRVCEAAEARGVRRLRFWCAACSSGQEPYSLAMLCLDHLDLERWEVEIVASDVSERTLEFARSGSYTALEVNRGLPSQALLRHFEQDGIRWRVRREVRELVRFERVNLVAPWPRLGVFDVILLRNVLIYFELDTRRSIFRALKGALRRSGYLLLGGSELTMSLTRDFEHERLGKSSCFRLK